MLNLNNNFILNPRPKLLSLTSVNHSQHSIIQAMDRFVDCIDKMHDTILVPSRLKDMSINDEQINLLGQSDAYELYLMLTEIKNELTWGPTTSSVPSIDMASNFKNLTLTSNTLKEENSYVKNQLNVCQSNISLEELENCPKKKSKLISATFSNTDDGFCSMLEGSSNSLTSSLSEEESTEGSLSESEDNESFSNTNLKEKNDVENKDTFHLAAAFRLHLRGLYAILHQLSDTAVAITDHYQRNLQS